MEFVAIKEEEYEIWELIKKYPDELGFVLQEKSYVEYCNTFIDAGMVNESEVVLTEEEFYKIKRFFERSRNETSD